MTGEFPIQILVRDIPSVLFQHAVDLVQIVQLQSLRGVVGFDAVSVQQETQRARQQTLAGRVRIEHLLHSGGPFDLEVYFFTGLSDVCPVKKVYSVSEQSSTATREGSGNTLERYLRKVCELMVNTNDT